MKTSTSIRILISLLAVNAGVLWGAPAAANLAGATLPAPTPYAIVSRDAHSRVWERTVYESGPSGQAIPSKHRYVELATGLNYWSNGQWQESQELIESFPGGAIARQGQHQVIFANNLATMGAIDMQTPDGKRMRSHVLGLSYFDTASGQSVLIAEVKDSQGQLYSPNVVIYPDAFTDFKADVRYTYTRAGFEQDIILHERPPGPEAYGLNPATTRLQVLTEFLNPPQPVKKQASLKTRQGDALDEDLDFGAMQMGRGKAFLLEQGGGNIPVSKQWLKLEGRDFLVEEVAVPDLEEELQALPAEEGVSLNPAAGSVRHVVSKQRLLPAMPLVQAGTNEMQLAGLSLPSKGLVLDYVTMTAQTNYTFQGDTTYYLSGAVNLSGTNTFEGGAVLKYATNASLTINGVSGQINWLATAYRPVVFTAKDDNSVGQSISGSTGNPTNYYANPALAITYSGSQTISNFRIACAQQAISLSSDGLISFYHGQLVNCLGGLTVNNGNACLRNVLFSNVQTNFNNIAWATNDVQNATFSGSTYLMTIGISGNAGLVLTNCIFANITNLCSGTPSMFTGGYNGFYNAQPFGAANNGSATFPFQTVGAGNYYLSTNCAFVNAGTANIDPTLLAALNVKTTFPPIPVSNVTISTATSWSPTAQRDIDVPDLGYHYDPLDYLCSQITLTGSHPLLLTNGVAVGLFGTAGFNIGYYGLTSSGQANAMNRLVWYPAVQEQPLRINGVSTVSSSIFSLTGPSTPRIITLNFTDVPMQGSSQPFFYSPNAFNYPMITLKNCWLRGVAFSIGPYQANGFSGPTVTLQNNLIERSAVTLYNGYLYNGGNNYSQNPLAVTLYNNLFWHGSLNLSYYDSQATFHMYWTIKDNLFDTTSFSFSGDGSYANYIGISNDGFYNTSNPLGGSSHVTVTNLSYATSWFGPWYIGSSSPTVLYAGSRSAASAGLYHYTIQTNQVPDGANTVSIGFHYVAADAYGNPLDTDGDGVPDYLEDANGNGVYDAGDLSDWLISPFNGLTRNAGLQVFTPLK